MSVCILHHRQMTEGLHCMPNRVLAVSIRHTACPLSAEHGQLDERQRGAVPYPLVKIVAAIRLSAGSFIYGVYGRHPRFTKRVREFATGVSGGPCWRHGDGRSPPVVHEHAESHGRLQRSHRYNFIAALCVFGHDCSPPCTPLDAFGYMVADRA